MKKYSIIATSDENKKPSFEIKDSSPGDTIKFTIAQVVKAITDVCNDSSLSDENKLHGVEHWLNNYKRGIKKSFQPSILNTVSGQFKSIIIVRSKEVDEQLENNLKYLEKKKGEIEGGNHKKENKAFYIHMFPFYYYYKAKDSSSTKESIIRKVFKAARELRPRIKQLPHERTASRFFEKMLAERNSFVKKLDK